MEIGTTEREGVLFLVHKALKTISIYLDTRWTTLRFLLTQLLTAAIGDLFYVYRLTCQSLIHGSPCRCVQGPFLDWRYSSVVSPTKPPEWHEPRVSMKNDTDNLFNQTSKNNTKVKIGAVHVVS